MTTNAAVLLAIWIADYQEVSRSLIESDIWRESGPETWKLLDQSFIMLQGTASTRLLNSETHVELAAFRTARSWLSHCQRRVAFRSLKAGDEAMKPAEHASELESALPCLHISECKDRRLPGGFAECSQICATQEI